MNTPDTLTTLFQHHLWANLRLVERCMELTGTQLASTADGSYGSIFETLRHITTAEKSYFQRISTGKPFPRPENPPEWTLPMMAESLRQSGEGLIEWSSKVPAGETVKVQWWDETIKEVPKAIIFAQALCHATEHRSQVMTIMTQLGIEPPDLQSWQYFDEAP